MFQKPKRAATKYVYIKQTFMANSRTSEHFKKIIRINRYACMMHVMVVSVLCVNILVVLNTADL